MTPRHCEALAGRRHRGIRVEGVQLRLAQVSSNFIKHPKLIRGGMKPLRLTQAAVTTSAPKCIVFLCKSSFPVTPQHCDALAGRRHRGVRVEGDQFRLARVSSNFINHQEPIRGDMKPLRPSKATTTDPTAKCIVFLSALCGPSTRGGTSQQVPINKISIFGQTLISKSF